MSLTGIPLILLAAGATVGVITATVLVWRRWGRWRYVVRPIGVLLIEALLTLTVGLAVNRSQQFYPSWAALFATSDPPVPTSQTAAGRLDTWLAGRPNPTQTQTFPWEPTGWKAWHLAAPPTITVPAGYLQHPDWRYSAVVTLADPADGWQAPGRMPAIAGPTVLIHLTTTAETTPDTVGVALPGELGRDLRVTGHRWALVSSASDGPLARQAVSGTGGRYPAVAFVGNTSAGGKAATPPGKKPAGKPSTATASSADPLPVGVETNYFPLGAAAQLTESLRAALTWAAAQTPAPLAASVPEPKYLPIPPKKSPAPPTAGGRGPHQPRRTAPAKQHNVSKLQGGPDGSGQPRP